jgi:hypothetical protein
MLFMKGKTYSFETRSARLDELTQDQVDLGLEPGWVKKKI